MGITEEIRSGLPSPSRLGDDGGGGGGGTVVGDERDIEAAGIGRYESESATLRQTGTNGGAPLGMGDTNLRE
ncbi:hypothetical protein ACFX13_031071 [Malus domestica]